MVSTNLTSNQNNKGEEKYHHPEDKIILKAHNKSVALSPVSLLLSIEDPSIQRQLGII